MREGKEVDLDERGGGEKVIVEGAKSVIRIHCVKKIIFNQKNIKTNKTKTINK